MDILHYLKSHLKGKIVILGIGNSLRSDDGAGSILASRLKEKLHFQVFDGGVSPENYLEKIIKEKPDTVIIVDAADFGGSPGEFKILEAKEVKTINLFSTHNTSISLIINYLQSHLAADIIILIIQPKLVNLQDKLSPEIEKTLLKLEEYFYVADQEKR